MSHAVQIDYAKIGLQCQSICDIAEKRLTELEEMLEEIDRTTSRLKNDQTALFHHQLEQEKEAVRTRLHAVQDKAQALINRGVQTMDSDYLRREFRNTSRIRQTARMESYGLMKTRRGY